MKTILAKQLTRFFPFFRITHYADTTAQARVYELIAHAYSDSYARDTALCAVALMIVCKDDQSLIQQHAAQLPTQQLTQLPEIISTLCSDVRYITVTFSRLPDRQYRCYGELFLRPAGTSGSKLTVEDVLKWHELVATVREQFILDAKSDLVSLRLYPH